jgi:hypothetical protein
MAEMTSALTSQKLIIGLLLFAFGAGCVRAEEMLVGLSGGDLLILRDSTGVPVRKKIAADVSQFTITRSGHFILEEDKTEAWYKGSVNSSLDVKIQLIRSAPNNPRRIAISEDGKRVAWANDNEDCIGCELIIQEYNGELPTLLRKISADGVFTGLAFSPDSNTLAFYFGPPDALVSDGFSLMLLNVNDANSRPVSIAPPSVGHDMNPHRSAPIWSPDGKSIIFEACYSDQGIFHGGRTYILSLEDRQMIACRYRGEWDPGGKHYYALRLKEKGNPYPLEFTVVELDVFNKKERIIRELKIPDGMVDRFVLSPSAKKIAYIQWVLEGVSSSNQSLIASKGLSSKGEVLSIYDSTTQQTTSFGHDFVLYPTWIIPAEAGKGAGAGTRSPAAIPVAGSTMTLSFPGKEHKGWRLVAAVEKIRAKEIERDHIIVSEEDTREIAEFFISDGGMGHNLSQNPEELLKFRHTQTQRQVEAWLLFRKVTQADSLQDAGMSISELVKRERKWWKSRLNSYRQLIDDDILDEEILAIITNRFELSAAKEEFLRNYYAKKTR